MNICLSRLIQYDGAMHCHGTQTHIFTHMYTRTFDRRYRNWTNDVKDVVCTYQSIQKLASVWIEKCWRTIAVYRQQQITQISFNSGTDDEDWIMLICSALLFYILRASQKYGCWLCTVKASHRHYRFYAIHDIILMGYGLRAFSFYIKHSHTISRICILVCVGGWDGFTKGMYWQCSA